MSKTRDQDYDRDYNRDYNRDYRDNKFTRFFDDFLSDAKAHVGSRLRSTGDGGGRRQPNWIPTIDVTENEREYTVVVDVPGVRKEDVDIEFNDSVLVISGHHRRDPTTTAAQNVNVKHDRDHPQPPDSANYQSNQYKKQPPTDYQQQPQTDYQQQQQHHPQQQQPTEYQQQQKPTEYQQQPTGYQQQQKPTEYQQQPTEYQQQQQQQPPTEYPQQQQQTDYQSSQKPPPTDYQQSSNQQSNQQPTELHRMKKSHHKDNRDEEYEKVHIQERHYGYFSRSIQLPSNIKNDVEFPAKLENGVLRIQVPKNNERPRRKITIL